MKFYFGAKNEIREIYAPFYISKYPVTVAQFVHFLKESSYNYNHLHLDMMHRISPDPECPVSPVSWWDAKYFIRWLRYVTNEYYSLPMSTEWEAACRANDGRKYPWGDEEISDLHASFSQTVPRLYTEVVGTHPLGNSPFSCSDMIGNVWEWCLDTTDDETQAICRGGSCSEVVPDCNAISSRYYPTHMQTNYVGFRLTYLPGQMFEDYKIAQSS